MASGKSLELANLKRPEPQHICICGGIWEEHLRKDRSQGPVLLKKYADGNHYVRGRVPLPRGARRRMR